MPYAIIGKCADGSEAWYLAPTRAEALDGFRLVGGVTVQREGPVRPRAGIRRRSWARRVLGL